MGAAALPLALAGGSIGGSIASSLVNRSARNAAMQRSPEESRFINAQTGLLSQLTGQGQQLFGRSLPLLNSAAGYQQRALTGDRATLRGLVAPEAERVGQVYQGAEAGVAATQRGGERALALGRLARDRAGQLAGLTRGVRQQAAGDTASLGLGQLYPAASMQGQAAGGYAGLLGNATANRQGANAIGQQQGDQFGEAFGGVLADLLRYYAGRGGSSPLASRPLGVPFLVR